MCFCFIKKKKRFSLIGNFFNFVEKIFNQLDRDGNGQIDIHDLSEALKGFGFSHQYAEVRALKNKKKSLVWRK